MPTLSAFQWSENSRRNLTGCIARQPGRSLPLERRDLRTDVVRLTSHSIHRIPTPNVTACDELCPGSIPTVHACADHDTIPTTDAHPRINRPKIESCIILRRIRTFWTTCCQSFSTPLSYSPIQALPWRAARSGRRTITSIHNDPLHQVGSP